MVLCPLRLDLTLQQRQANGLTPSHFAGASKEAMHTLRVGCCSLGTPMLGALKSHGGWILSCADSHCSVGLLAFHDAQVFGGGPVLTANPEPYADYFDVVLLGDGEEMLAAFTERLIEAKAQLAVAGGGWCWAGGLAVLVLIIMSIIMFCFILWYAAMRAGLGLTATAAAAATLHVQAARLRRGGSCS